MTTDPAPGHDPAAVEAEGNGGYRRRVRAWILYDVANSGFATTVLAAVFPVYYASVAGATLPTAATATQYYSLTLSASVLVLAIASPVLGTFADVTATKVRLLEVSAVVGILATAALATTGEGDWLLASVIFAVARMGFGSANVFYDALLPHVARPGDVDRVSAHGFAFGYLGGGTLLAINVGMIFALGEEFGTQLALLSVAAWWTVFSIPLVRRVDEPTGVHRAAPGAAWQVTWRRLRSTWDDLRVARDLRRYLFAFLVYNDAIGTVIALAAIYASELRIGTTDVVLALLLVQFSGMAFSLLFGRLPEIQRPRQPVVTAFLVAMVLALPVTGLLGGTLLPAEVSGEAPPPHEAVGDAIGDGVVAAATFTPTRGAWSSVPLPAGVVETLGVAETGAAGALEGVRTAEGGTVAQTFNGRRVEITYTEQPGGGTLVAAIDGRPAVQPDGTPARVDTAAATPRLDATLTATTETDGLHTLTLTAEGGPVEIAAVEVLPPERESALGVITGLLAATVAAAATFAFTVGRRLLAPIARRLDTRGGILLALWAYTLIAVWGFVIGSVLEFWCLALMVGVVQGGSQALSRSLYASLVPTAMTGEYFGFFSVLEKFASVVSPLLFALSVAIFASSRPAVLALAAFFVAGMWLLRGVDVDRGRRQARARDAELRGAAEASRAR